MTEYRIPKGLSEFQEQMYKHLIDWKQEHITNEPGEYSGHTYDAIFPDNLKGKLPHLYEPVRQMFMNHQKTFHFKTHKFADHMASSQIACANLFLPIMNDADKAPEILRSVKPDIAEIAADELDNGFRIEFWDEDPDGATDQKGALGDHNRSTGTDSDFALAYRNDEGQRCLWLIEHKLTEAEFTTCGGAKSKGRKSGNYSCESVADIMQNPSICYYQGKCEYHYWDITLANEDAFPRGNLSGHTVCPFKGGMNQLWRNTVLALAIENATKGPYAKYQKVYFSVCHHPKNTALNDSMNNFRELLGDDDHFSSFTPDLLVAQIEADHGQYLNEWAKWYREVYLF